ncbi:MAG: hypothetical protein PQJ35_01920 [Sphaerochaetaceae bacterium]|nr:hypothetical protein [Sphaerochaetaceae bacterium]
MKKSIVLITSLLLVIGSVSAAPEISGSFGLDYTLGFDGTLTPSGVDSDLNAAEVSITLSTDYWDLTLRDIAAAGSDVAAAVTLDVDALLEEVEIELPVELDALVGNQNFFSTSVYTDPSGAEGDYYCLYSESISRGNLPFGLSVGYNDMITVEGGIDVIDGGKFMSVELYPAEGLSFAANMASDATFDTYDIDGLAVTASAAADITVLADLDFDLSFSGAGWFAIDDASLNSYFVAVSGGKDAVSTYLEYTNEQGTSNVNVGAGYELSDAVSTSAGVNLADVFNSLTFGAWASASYTIADVTTFVTYGFSDNGTSLSDRYIQAGMDFDF